MPRRTLRWQDATGCGLEHLSVEESGAGLQAEGVVIGAEGPAACHYAVACDEAFHARRLSVRMIGEERGIILTSNGHGTWRINGTDIPELKGTIDIDFSCTPFTNTLPIRRLGLAIGRSAEIVAAYVAFPGLEIYPDPQRYTRIAARTFLYESIDTDFEAEITVDKHGFVLDYQGLFTRVDVAAAG
jgi:hypothetical protein